VTTTEHRGRNEVDSERLRRVRAYHERSKHGFHGYAPGPGFLDWNTQPDPFRRYPGTEQVPLPLGQDRIPVAFPELYQPTPPAVQPLCRDTVSALLELSFGLSAWKGYGGERWALRCNPSSGNLHPTEAYVVTAGIPGLEAGVYHYVSHDHALERRNRAVLPEPGGILVALTSILWREAWKYGERAYRYCQHDAGHALGALRYAAAVLGWRIELLDEWGDKEIAALLGLDREEDYPGAEREAPDLLCRILIVEKDPPRPAPEVWVPAAKEGRWAGRANVLSRTHRHIWPAAEEMERVCRKPRTAPARRYQAENHPPLLVSRCKASANVLIRQRRSAQVFDGASSIRLDTFCRLLDATLPRWGILPFDAWPWPPRIHFCLFVHRVDGLLPGLYLFARSRTGDEELRRAVGSRLPANGRFEWARPAGGPEHFLLYRLLQGDARSAAKALSCHQDIAGDGAFSLGMVAEFDAALEEGPWGYRRLFWEAGLIGQVLYLEAEAAGIRGTGIGCFFDDPVHELLGLADSRLQSLYHFTVGKPLPDTRIESFPPYAHLSASRRSEARSC
jgi:SagB-type dehydrogenase family enzyme